MHYFRTSLLLVTALLFLNCSNETYRTEVTQKKITADISLVTKHESLRSIEFSDPLLIGPLIDLAGGGEVNFDRIHFADLIGNDSIDEAFVVVESGGTIGDLGIGIFQLRNEYVELVQFIPAVGKIEFRMDLIVAIEGIWAKDDDAMCCPYQLLERSYQWDGESFILNTEQIITSNIDNKGNR